MRELNRRSWWDRPHASRTTQYSASWPYRELRRRSECDRPHASRATRYSVSAPIWSSTDGPSGTARVRHAPPSTALRGPIGSSTDGPSEPPACIPRTQDRVS
eukprot:3445264-Pyramimonas_sp.AAC.1